MSPSAPVRRRVPAGRPPVGILRRFLPPVGAHLRTGRYAGARKGNYSVQYMFQ